MDAFTISAASGMRARLESLEIIANNLANQSSPGFKPDREMYGLYVSAEARAEESDLVVRPPTAPVVERHWTDFTQGALRTTGAPLDLALDGKGFFSVQSERGALLTRNGSFRLTPSGVLETQDGYAVLDDRGQPIRLNPGGRTEIARDGEIRQDGAVIARLAIVAPADRGELTKRAGTYFQAAGPAPAAAAGETAIHQGRLEASGQVPAEGAVRLINVMRQFESLTKAVQIHAEMNRRADDIARVGN